MKNRNNLKKYILLVLVICVATLTIAYAVLSTSLTISGGANVQASSWKIQLKRHENTSSLIKQKVGSATSTEPTLSGTTISYNATFTKPGDSVTYQFTFFNAGSLVGELTSIVHSTPTCTSATGKTADATLVCNNLIYTLKYADGTTVSVGDTVANGGSLYSYICYNGATTDLQSGSKLLYLTITFSSAATSVPSSKVTISNLKTEFLFSQTQKKCTTGGGSAPTSE